MKLFHTALYGALALGFAQHAHAVCYVNTNATGANSGASWKDAFVDLQSAVKLSSCTETWVAKGVYKPTADPSDRQNYFYIQPGTAIYGGFDGTELVRDARDPNHNLTILSGDIDSDDAHAADDQIDRTPTDIHGQNSTHVVFMEGAHGTPLTEDTVLDGFTITGGNNEDDDLFEGGSGLYCSGGGLGGHCNPTLSNLVFSGNDTGYNGAALMNDGGYDGESSPVLTNVRFEGNGTAANTLNGGAMTNEGTLGVSSPQMHYVTFENNTTQYDGGAIFNDGNSGISSPVMDHVIFRNNTAGEQGGAMMNWGPGSGAQSSPNLTETLFESNVSTKEGGAIYNYGIGGGQSSPRLLNVTFHANKGSQGGAMYDDGEGGASSPTLANVTFADNEASTGSALVNNGSFSGEASPGLLNATFSGNIAKDTGSAIVNIGDSMGTSAPVFANTILWGDQPSSAPEVSNSNAQPVIFRSVVQGGCPAAATCTDLITSDPLLSALGYHWGFTPVMRPSMGGSAVDAGDDATCAPIDQRGFARPQGAHCDIGAVELRQPSDDIVYPGGF